MFKPAEKSRLFFENYMIMNPVHSIESWQVEENNLYLQFNAGTGCICMYANGAIRFRYSRTIVGSQKSYMLSDLPLVAAVNVTCECGRITLIPCAGNYRIIINISPFTIALSCKDEKIITSGHKDFLQCNSKVTAIKFELDDNEAVYGLGQDPMANLNQRGFERRVFHQYGHIRRSGNIAMPFFMSSRGYGIFLHSPYPSRFGIGESRTAEFDRLGMAMAEFPLHWTADSQYADVNAISILLDEDDIDLFIMPGDYMNILKCYYELTGKPALLPKWAFGYIQSQCRYRCQDELIAIAEHMRQTNTPADVIVIDWLWFKEFGDLVWDERSWPDPAAMFRQLESLGFHAIMAQHPFISPKSIHAQTFEQRGFFNKVPPGKRLTFDHSNPRAREAWWELIKPILSQGAKGYWTDMGELEEHHCGTTSATGSREAVHNIYMLLWTLGLYEGQRRDFPSRRFFSLNRAYYPGMQRYGTALWSGDIDSSWEIMKEQVVIAQGACLSGIPYWSCDSGGFLTIDGFTPQLFIRWLQWSVLCPVFRSHGTRPFNEPWSLGKQAQDICRHYIGLRYRLLPYIYSLARQMHENGEPMMRALVLEYPDDPKAAGSIHQFMLGPYLLAAPVLDKAVRWKEVYLPHGTWYDYDTGAIFAGGRTYTVNAPLCRMPLFVKAGAIIPQYDEPIMHIPRKHDVCTVIHVYPGACCSFTLYDDSGDGYAHETGDYYSAEIHYNDATHAVSVNPVHVPQTGEPPYDIIIHTAASQLPSVQLYADCDMENDGTLHICLCWENTGFDEEAPLTALLSSNPYWSVSRIDTSFHNSLLYSRKVMYPDEQRKVRLGNTGCMHYTLNPCSLSMPAAFSASISVEVVTNDGTSALNRKLPLEWGDGSITAWSFCGYFPNTSDRGLNISYPPEEDVTMPYYYWKDRLLPWITDIGYRYNCFGYVELRRYGVYEDQADERIHAVTYAKTHVYSPRGQTVLLNISGETGIKIWVNGKEIFLAQGIIINQKSTAFMFDEGWNTLLVKTSVFTEKPYSGREFGFKILPENESGDLIEGLLYKV